MPGNMVFEYDEWKNEYNSETLSAYFLIMTELNYMMNKTVWKKTDLIP